MKEQPKYSPEVIEPAVRMAGEAPSEYSSQWAAIESIAAKIGCTPETLRRWVRQQERDTGQRPGPITAEEERIKALERENRVAESFSAGIELGTLPMSPHRGQLRCCR